MRDHRTLLERERDEEREQMLLVRQLSVLTIAAVLGGCASTFGWVDMTKLHRNVAREHSDYQACSTLAGIAQLDPDATYDETAAYRGRLTACMFSRGWRTANPWRL